MAARGSGAKKKTSRARSTGGAGEPDPIVIYVHGIGRHPPKAEIKLEWDIALFGRDLGARSRFAYWSDIVHPGTDAAGAQGVERKSDDRHFDLDAVLTAAGVDPEDSAVRGMALDLLAHLGIDAPRAAARGAGKRVLPLPGVLRRPVSRAFLEALIADTAAYFFRPGIRRRVRERLVAELPGPRQPVTIVAHSQGSIIAYEVLSGLTKERLDLVAFVTIGSPLGVREIQDFLVPDTLRVPDVVGRWHNFADPLDPVALDKRIAGDFAPRERIQDEIILNTRSRSLFEFDPHSAVGYLAHPAVRRVVSAALREDVMARFVIARDVAETLAATHLVRRPVLIEILEPGYGALDETETQRRAFEQREATAVTERPLRQGQAVRLEDRIEAAARRLEAIVATEGAKPGLARIDRLRRFVAAHLTARELRMVAASHKDMRVYAVWKSSIKRKLTHRSISVIKADAALASFKASGEQIVWAVLDTGIQANHPHFSDGAFNTIASVWDCTKPGAPVLVRNATDRDGHGTHVAGIIAGKSATSRERGVAPHAKLVVYKVLDDKGEGEDAWIIKALDHIARTNEEMSSGLAIHGLNLSLGGPFDATVYGCGFSPICKELRRLWRAGVLVVVASGNEGQLEVDTPDGAYEINAPMSIGDPANLEDCIVVGSVNADRPHLYGVSAFSSRGPTADGRAKPDVVAPGERISSCNSRFRPGRNNLYFEDSGTSMAAPHVSGLLAAFLSARREFRGRPDEVKRLLLSTCTDIGRDRYHQGHGVPNLMQMLLSA